MTAFEDSFLYNIFALSQVASLVAILFQLEISLATFCYRILAFRKF